MLLVICSDKRRKSKGSHKSDRKDRGSFNDGSTPTTMKIKNVHGLVGPAEYITDNSPTHNEAQTQGYNNQNTSPNAKTSQKTANQIFSTQQNATPVVIQQQQQKTP